MFGSKNIFKEIILEFQEKPIPSLVERELVVKEHDVVCIIGPRRVGKTYYFYQLIRKFREENKPYLYVNFEHELLLEVDVRSLSNLITAYIELYGSKPQYILLDEVHVVDKWYLFVRRLEEEGYNVFITGSSSKLMAREIATQLRGRAISYILLPFSFREYLKAKNVRANLKLAQYSNRIRSNILSLLREYMDYGGFPEPVLKRELYYELLTSIRDGIFYRDIIERYNIRRPYIMEAITRMLAESYSRYHTITGIHNKLKSLGINVSKSTVYEYIRILEEVLLFFYVPLIKTPVHEATRSPRKTYIVDTGLLNIYGVEKNQGKLMENTVFLELLRLKNNEPTLTINYWKDRQGREVDFVVSIRGKPRTLVQVTYELSTDNRRRELLPLVTGSTKLGAKKLIVITWDQEYNEKYMGKNIQVIPLWKWLLLKPEQQLAQITN